MGKQKPAATALLAAAQLIAALAAVALLTGCANQSTETLTAETLPAQTADQTADQTPDQTPRDAGSGTSLEIPTTAPLEQPSKEPPPTPIPIKAPNGAIAPKLAETPDGIAAQLNEALNELLNTAPTDTTTHSPAAHLHNVAVYKLGATPEWDEELFAALDEQHHDSIRLHLQARRALADLSAGYDAATYIPAWRIIPPAPAEELLSYYKAAETQTGIEWEYLAAINLIETGMGRIVGLSSAGAQGPMQFMPTTWEEHGIGAGDINSPADAIPAAARYLVRRGGPENMDQALWGYNNHDAYVEAVGTYAEILRQDPRQYHVIHGWEIYFYTQAGPVWLPVGFETQEAIALDRFLAENPWSK